MTNRVLVSVKNERVGMQKEMGVEQLLYSDCGGECLCVCVCVCVRVCVFAGRP